MSVSCEFSILCLHYFTVSGFVYAEDLKFKNLAIKIDMNGSIFCLFSCGGGNVEINVRNGLGGFVLQHLGIYVFYFLGLLTYVTIFTFSRPT